MDRPAEKTTDNIHSYTGVRADLLENFYGVFVCIFASVLVLGRRF